MGKRGKEFSASFIVVKIERGICCCKVASSFCVGKGENEGWFCIKYVKDLDFSKKKSIFARFFTRKV